MFYPPITYQEILKGHVVNNDPSRDEVIQYLRRFIAYLKNKPLSDNSIRMYINRLLKEFLNEKFSLQDLLGSLKDRIRDYSPEGEYYDVRDHNNTLSALKNLREFYWEGRLPKFIYISISSGWQSFATNHQDHPIFVLENNKVHVPRKQKMSDYDFYHLQELILENLNYLSASNTALSTVHGPAGYYDYVIGESPLDNNAYRGNQCQGLFNDDNLNKKFIKIISKYR